MKNPNIKPTTVEKVMREDDFIVSKTDLKGRITYGNRIFIEYSGYSASELLGAQHNIIRHPDMPRAVFKLLWDTIQARQECFAYVKNMAKDGSFYWVFANITPSFDASGNPLGYYSVRRKPKASAVKTMSDLYRAMLDAEARAGARDAMAASGKLLTDLLQEKGVSYEELILSI
ncbi:MAG: PAS domain-containing protein [Hydrogenophilales bacterium]|nr:PAS domain-containing protein [Hydrogenophilales bacterium]